MTGHRTQSVSQDPPSDNELQNYFRNLPKSDFERGAFFDVIYSNDQDRYMDAACRVAREKGINIPNFMSRWIQYAHDKDTKAATPPCVLKSEKEIEQIIGGNIKKAASKSITSSETKKVPDFEEYDSEYFNNAEIASPEPIIEQILYPGLGMLGAPAKMGKSYLLLQMTFAIAEGKDFLGFSIKRPGAVLYLDLQGSPARTKQRMNAMGYTRMPKGISIVYKSLKTDTGLFDQINSWIKRTECPVLIIVDMMEQVKGSQQKSEDAYRADNRILEPLHDIALKNNISIMVSMHTRKGNKILPDDDPFNEIIGSIAQFGTADCAWMIIGKRNKDLKRFSTICRDNVEGQQDYEVIFNNHRWSMAGTAEACAEERAKVEYSKNPIVFTIKKLVDESGGGWYGTMSDLIREVLQRKQDYPATTPEKMYHLVNEISYRLYAEDRISFEPQNRNGGPKGRRYKFYREDPKQIEV